ncbi:hypothetical protein TNCV_1126531 [Trichonephila clavipes]|nr:hypothetical protein TNCV_1126531 [Trichonephila clavipes]
MYGGQQNAQREHCNLPKETVYSSLMPDAKQIKDTLGNNFCCLFPSNMLTVDYLNEKEFQPVVNRTYPGGYSQYPSDSLIDRPSIWCTRHGDGADSQAGLLSQRTDGIGMTRSTGCRFATLSNQR